MHYEIAGLGATDDLDIVAGFNLFKKLKKIGRTVAKVAPAALPVAALIPGVGPAALAATAALRVADAARKGSKPAKVAMDVLGKRADAGDRDAQKWIALMTQATPMLDARCIHRLAVLARMGVPQAQVALRALSSAADFGNVRAQRAFESASGTYRARSAGGATMWEQLQPHALYLPDSEVFTPRDAYHEGLRVLRGEYASDGAATQQPPQPGSV
jgi:hypothetical protein